MPQFPCMALPNFIRDNNINDVDFQSSIQDDSTHGTESSIGDESSSGEDMDMGALRDAIGEGSSSRSDMDMDDLCDENVWVIA